jgi:hypothetical protein
MEGQALLRLKQGMPGFPREERGESPQTGAKPGATREKRRVAT